LALENQKITNELRGNTLRVYLYALKQGNVGVREVQRSLGLSNASLAQYHINKLAEMGLLKEEGGGYRVVGEVKVDVLRDFTRFGRILVPRFVFYGMLFTVFTVYLSLVTVQSYATDPIVGWFAVLLAAASAIFWYEALRAWRTVP
jgi:hypothetical protein